MGTQRKVGTSLNQARQARLDAIVAGEPVVDGSESKVLALALDLMHAAWLGAGCDLKAALGGISARGEMGAMGMKIAPQGRRAA